MNKLYIDYGFKEKELNDEMNRLITTLLPTKEQMEQIRAIVELANAHYELEEKYEWRVPEIDEFSCIGWGGFTTNYMYDNIVKERRDGELYGARTKSKSYIDWLKRMSSYNHIIDRYKDVDFNKPVYIWLRFNHKREHDVENLSKSFIDMICNRLGVDDNQIQLMECTTNEIIKEYYDGRIYFLLKN